MFKLSRMAHSSRYTPIVGCAFLVETLYGSKYSANLGAYNMPYVYVKTILLCATGHGLELREGRYIHGLIELLLPSKVSQDNLTKLELLQFIDAIPMDRLLEGHAADSEEEAEVQATVALMSGGGAEMEHIRHPSSSPYQRCQTYGDLAQPLSHRRSGRAQAGDEDEDGEGGGGEQQTSGGAAAAQRRRQRQQQQQQLEEEEDAAAIESIMSFVSPSTFPSSMARVLVYDAVCTCVADGLYSAKEKERVALVSSHIGLSTAVRGQIEKLALQEKVLSIRKRRLLLLQQQQRQEEVRLRPASNVLCHAHTSGVREEEEHQGQRTSSGLAEESQMARDKAVAAGQPQQQAKNSGESGSSGSRTEKTEEARKIEAAKALLRRARRRQQKGPLFAATA